MNKSYRYLIVFSLLIVLQSAISAQTVPVTFRVNMGYQAAQNKFDPSKEYVDVAGTFNNWGSQQIRLTDADGDLIYEAVVNGFTPGAAIEFKFRINGQWNGREEFPNGGSNRRYVVKSDSNIVNVWYNNETSPTGPPKADFTANSQSLFENGVVNFEDHSSGSITSWKWAFEGGNPATSTDRNPAVYYPQSGSFDVSLIVSGPTGSDTLSYKDYILVNKRDKSKTS